LSLKEYLDAYEAAHRHPVNQLTHAIGIPLIVVSLPLFFFHWGLALPLFVVGWIFQFIGHAYEGNSPKFFQGPIFLLVGPLWVGIKVMQALGIKRRDTTP